MALFSTKKTNAEKGTKASTPAAAVGRNLSSVIVKPHVTEKAVQQGERNVYAFIISPRATKRDVRDAVTALYNVAPVKIHIVNREPRPYKSRRLGRMVTKEGQKKAYVYLKTGETINLI